MTFNSIPGTGYSELIGVGMAPVGSIRLPSVGVASEVAVSVRYLSEVGDKPVGGTEGVTAAEVGGVPVQEETIDMSSTTARKDQDFFVNENNSCCINLLLDREQVNKQTNKNET
jgi:hypothetical protein